MYYYKIYVLGRSSYVEMESRTTKVAELAEQIGNTSFEKDIFSIYSKILRL